MLPGRDQARLPTLPRVQQPPTRPILEREQGFGAEADLPIQRRIVAHERPGDVARRHRPMDGVGLDVFVEIRRRDLARAEPAKAVAVPAIRRARGHLERGQMPHRGASEPTVEPEQRHQVDGRQGGAGQRIDVGAGRIIEARCTHRGSEQRGMDPRRVPAPVLVGLDLDQRRFRVAAKAGDHPRVWDPLPSGCTRIDASGTPRRASARHRARGTSRARHRAGP